MKKKAIVQANWITVKSWRAEGNSFQHTGNNGRMVRGRDLEKKELEES